jgi:hypothetical protein
VHNLGSALCTRSLTTRWKAFDPDAMGKGNRVAPAAAAPGSASPSEASDGSGGGLYKLNAV